MFTYPQVDLWQKFLPYYLKHTQANQASHNAAQLPHPVEVPMASGVLSNPQFTPLCSRTNHLGHLAIPRQTADEILGFVRPVQMTHNVKNSLDSEIDAYLLDPNTGTSSMVFWQVSQSLFSSYLPSLMIISRRINLLSHLFLAALDCLPIQASAVPCKQVFSSAKETMAA